MNNYFYSPLILFKTPIIIAYGDGKHGITNYKAGDSSVKTVWGLNDWLDENGTPKPQFTYNAQFLSTRK